jgi:hypothetical protein
MNAGKAVSVLFQEEYNTLSERLISALTQSSFFRSGFNTWYGVQHLIFDSKLDMVCT